MLIGIAWPDGGVEGEGKGGGSMPEAGAARSRDRFSDGCNEPLGRACPGAMAVKGTYAVQ
ncbi:hypothetical protein Ssi02_08500 [Sinosporangium siamense]|uniref:Uncharacterized protein n=1 Tax=Sinosporangium siamense TaxID=1367973 RepID=A0A919VA03_9ACTN|nr:hypothetical protein Ssi02_08500 [Sinosporangium siamense]